MIANPITKEPIIYDQRVRGHDFLAYFKSHMTSICLLFWFFTISVSVTASAIYLLKQIEDEIQEVDPTTGKTTFNRMEAGGREKDETDSASNEAYANYDVLGFLIDALYAGDEANSHNRSKQASRATTTAMPKRTTSDVIYQGPEYDIKTTGGRADDRDDYIQ